MEVLPISSTHFILSPQIDQLTSNCSDSFVSDRNGHRFKTPTLTFRPISISNVSRPKLVKKDKVVFVLGTTGTGKSKLAIDLAAHFDGEVVNSDKMQVYDGLNVITNKVTEEECAGVPHHLIGGVHPDADYTSSDFCREAMASVQSIVARGRLPIIAGGSNSYIEELVKLLSICHDCLFLWIDVHLPVLHRFVDARVEKMVEMGLVEEARGVFDPAADYSKGIRRSIGVRELDRYFRAREEEKAGILKEAIGEIKANTRELTCKQLGKIRRLSALPGWEVVRVDATDAFRRRGKKDAETVWIRAAREPSVGVVYKFLMAEHDDSIFKKMGAAGGGGEGHEHKVLELVGATRLH